MEQIKMQSHTKGATMTKNAFPPLLKSTIEELSVQSQDNLKSGFRNSGIFLLNPSQPLDRLPDSISSDSDVSESFFEHLK